MSAIDALSEEIMKRLNRPNNTFIPLIVRRLVPTEEEAKVILELPQSSEEIANKLNISKDRVDEIIQEKFEMGIVYPTRHGWQLLRSWAQFRESTLGMEPKYDNKVGKEFFILQRAWNEIEEYPRMVQKYIELKVKAQRCIPDWQAIKDNPDRITAEYLPDILDRASKLEGMGNITAVNCPCKRMVGDEYKGNIKVCLQMGRSADYSLKRGTGKKLTVKEALQLLKEEEDRGAVHLSAGNIKNIPTGVFWMICNCYRDSCDMMDAALKAGLPVNTICAPSRYRAVVDIDKCKACQTCMERCNFSAIKLKQYPGIIEWKSWTDPDLCMGCGSCTLSCPTGARTLQVVRPSDFIPDESDLDFSF